MSLDKFISGSGAFGLPSGPNEIKYSIEGYKSDSPDRFNDVNVIPSSNITMQDVPHPVLGIDDLGNEQMMMPGGEYEFPGNYVTEYPMFQQGGATTADSLKVYNQAMKLQSFYDRMLDTELAEEPITNMDPKYVSDLTTRLKSGTTERDHLAMKDLPESHKRLIRGNKNPQLHYMSDMITGMIDPRAPMAIYDERIEPQGFKSYIPKVDDLFFKAMEDIGVKDTQIQEYWDFMDSYVDNASDYKTGLKKGQEAYLKQLTDPKKKAKYKEYMQEHAKIPENSAPGYNTLLPYYDPIMVKPDHMLTPEERKYRESYKSSKPKGTTDPKQSVAVNLRKRGMDSSFKGRKALAEEAGIEGYKGTAEQNKKLNDWVFNTFEGDQRKAAEEPVVLGEKPLIGPSEAKGPDMLSMKDKLRKQPATSNTEIIETDTVRPTVVNYTQNWNPDTQKWEQQPVVKDVAYRQDGGEPTGEVKARLAYEWMHGNPAVKRMMSGTDNPYTFPKGHREAGNTGTHYMSSQGNHAVPLIQEQAGNLALDENLGPDSPEAIRFDNPATAEWFANNNYKQFAAGMQPVKQDGGDIEIFKEQDMLQDFIPGYQTGGQKLPTIKDAGSYGPDSVWVPDWKTITDQAKKINAKSVRTEAGTIINFDDKWEVKNVMDDAFAPPAGQKRRVSGQDSIGGVPVGDIYQEGGFPNYRGEKQVTRTDAGKHIEKWRYNPNLNKYVNIEKDITYRDQGEPRTVYRRQETVRDGDTRDVQKIRRGIFGERRKEVETYEDGGPFQPHMMYDPETGQSFPANQYEQHLDMQEQGYTHDRPELAYGGDIQTGGGYNRGELNRFVSGGGLDRSKDYGSEKKPYPSVSSGDFAGGGRSYPIPTKADAVDALRLAGLHGRSDVRSKVFAKYPDLKKAYGGPIDYAQAGKQVDTRGAVTEKQVQSALEFLRNKGASFDNTINKYNKKGKLKKQIQIAEAKGYNPYAGNITGVGRNIQMDGRNYHADQIHTSPNFPKNMGFVQVDGNWVPVSTKRGATNARQFKQQHFTPYINEKTGRVSSMFQSNPVKTAEEMKSATEKFQTGGNKTRQQSIDDVANALAYWKDADLGTLQTIQSGDNSVLGSSAVDTPYRMPAGFDDVSKQLGARIGAGTIPSIVGTPGYAQFNNRAGEASPEFKTAIDALVAKRSTTPGQLEHALSKASPEGRARVKGMFDQKLQRRKDKATAAESWGVIGMQDGGEFQDMDLTDQEIAELRNQGIRVDVL